MKMKMTDEKEHNSVWWNRLQLRNRIIAKLKLHESLNEKEEKIVNECIKAYQKMG